MIDYIRDERGRVLGWKTETSKGSTTYNDNTGKVVSRVINNRTFDKNGSFRGYGDQGQRLLEKNHKKP